MAEKYESFETYLIKHLEKELSDLSQPVYAEVSKVFYQENVGGVLYQFEFEFPSIDDMPLKKGISGKDIPDFNKIAKDTIIKVQRVFPDGEVIVDFEFNVAGKGGDLEAYKMFSKSLAEGKGMKGVLLNYYDTFPVESTLPTTLENDITIPNTLEGIDTPTNVVDDIKLTGTMGGNTTPTGTNIAYANVKDLEQFIQFDRKAEGNAEKINEIKKSISSKGYLYDTAYDGGVVFGVIVDELGNVQIAEGNHRLQALIDFAKETRKKIYVPINPVLTSTGAGNKVQLTNTDNAYNSMKQLLTDMLEGNKNFNVESTINEKLGEPGRRIIELNSYTYPGGAPGTSTNQTNIKKFFNSIGLNTITYDELPNDNVYKTGISELPDTPGGSLGAAKLNDPLVFDSWIDNYTKTTTSFIDNLPLESTVKNQFNNLIKGRAKNLVKPSGVADAIDVWELGVLGLMIAAVAYKEYDEIPTILKNKTIDMFNAVLAPYNIPPVPKEQYNLDYEFIDKVVETGEKFMPTDIIIKKAGEAVKSVGEKGLATGFGYVPTTPKKTDTMETKQKIQPGVQEEKIFKEAKKKENIKQSMKAQYKSQVPKQADSFDKAIAKSKNNVKPKKGSGGGSGVKIL